MTAPEPPAPVLRAVAAVDIADRRTRLELLMEAAEDGDAVVGTVSLAACPGVPLASFALRGDEIEFLDVPCGAADRALARAFGVPAVTVRDHLSELVSDVIRDMLVPASSHPGGTTVH